MYQAYKDDDIAIIGMAGRFPEADDLEEFWANLIHGQESVRQFPESRLKELAEMVGFTPTIRFARFGYLDHSIRFEPEIFSLSQEECKLMDPQQRLLLELVEEAILDAGYNPENLFNQHVGVFVADNENRYTELAEVNSPMIFVNRMSASNAGRISYTYNFHGPALILGTACSSSMVALHYACQALKLAEADLAIVGGSNINLLPAAEEDVAKFPIFSPDMQVRTFDKRANGTISGEGGGVVLLKRLKQALEDGDPIHAIIKGSAINNDGKWSNGITAPSEKGQADVILRAVNSAGIDPRTISYVEAHGTGTSIGDPIEVAGLSAALWELGLPKQAVPVGALKTNIGHLDSAAGIAGIIKTVLALKHKQIPPSLHFSEPNPLIDFINSSVYVNDHLIAWESQNVRRAGVTSLSFVGTNAHVILEEAPDLSSTEKVKETRNLITLSARTPYSLRLMVQKLGKYITQHTDLNIDEIAYTLNCGRRIFPHKFVTIVQTLDELRQNLQTYLCEQSDNSVLVTQQNGTIPQQPETVCTPMQTSVPSAKSYSIFHTPQKPTIISAFIVPDLLDAVFRENWLSEDPVYEQYYCDLTERLTKEELTDLRIQYLLHISSIAHVLQRYGITPKVYVGFGLGEIIVDWIRGDLTFTAAVAKIKQYIKRRIEISDDRFQKGVKNILKHGVNHFFLTAPGKEIFNRFSQCLHTEVLLVNLNRTSLSLQQAVLEMMQKGFEPDWKQVYQGRGIKRLSLPGYCFDRKPYILQTSKYQQSIPGGVPAPVVPPKSMDPEKVLETLFMMLKGVCVGGEITPDDLIQAIDLDSVQVLQYSALVKQKFGVEIPLKLFFQPKTVREILQQIETLVIPNVGVANQIERQPIQEHYLVSSAQKRQFVLNQIEPDSLAYNLPGVFKVSGKIDRERLESAFKALIQRHEILRTSFTINTGRPVQIIHPGVEFHVSFIKCSESDLSQTVQGFVKPFDLTWPPLLRVGLIECSDLQLLIYDLHHIVSDGTSTWILFREFLQLYAGETLPEQRIQYRDFAIWQNEQMSTEQYQQAEHYWLNRFTGEIPLLNLPTDYPRSAVMDFRGAEISNNLSQQLVQRISHFAAEQGVTLYMVLLATYNVLLAKYTGQDDIIVGSPINGRSHADVQNLIGIFINTLALRNQPKSDLTFVEFLNQVKENALTAYENQDYQFEMLVNRLDLARDLSRNPLFDTMFILQNTSRAPITIRELVLTSYEMEKHISQFDLTLIAGEREGELNLCWEYSTSLFKPETIQQLATHFIQIIESVLVQPDQKIGEIDLLSEVEKHRLLHDLNRTEVIYQCKKTVNQLIELQAERTPQQVALVAGNEQLTYAEMVGRANKIARSLQKVGVQPGMIVGLMLRRSCDMICALLAVLKSGGTYLPIDPDYPEERITYMLNDSGAAILLTQSNLSGKVIFTGELVLVDQTNIGNATLQQTHTANDLAYIIYTSGSTGKPKGVMIEHRSVHNFIKGITERIEFSSGKTIVSLTTISFDIFGLESLLPLACGLKIIIANEDEQKFPELLADLLLSHGVDMLQTTPSRVKLLLEDERCRAALYGLQEIMVGGEAFPEDLLKQLQTVTGAHIYNMYGPTETTIWSAVADLTYTTRVHLGTPIANTQIYILDQQRKLVPQGVVGDLYIAGDGLARGYLNRPDLTAERFLPDPFRPGQRMYHTGDQARWLMDDTLEFKGRIDAQVKIRGYRIELGEIEHLLLKHPAIRAAVVLDRKDGRGDIYLCAYLVFHQDLSISELRDYLAHELPEYMIPAYFVSLSVIPLNSSGKIDRKALPAPDGSVKTGIDYVAPESGLETRLVKIFSELMGLDTVGIDDKFFEIGGDSVRIITFTNLVNQEFNCQLKVQDFFRYNTIRKLAEHLSSQNPVVPVKSMRKFKY